MLCLLKQKHWSPYIAGVIIGLLQVPAIFLLDATLGASSAFVTIAKQLYLMVFNHDAPHQLGVTNLWQVGLAIGVAMGAYFSAKLSNTKRDRISSVWAKEFNITRPVVRYALSFIGGVLLIVGARLANGCTSGNGISGTSQLSASSWVVLISMFASAVISALILRAITKRG
jgi:uncharacterized protein